MKIIISTNTIIKNSLKEEGFSIQDAIRASIMMDLEIYNLSDNKSKLEYIEIESIFYHIAYEKCLKLGISVSEYLGELIFEFYKILTLRSSQTFVRKNIF
ncbi:MAG: hypothetical protein KDK36_06695 [Leptospiraceae bacterium]|nr:hypothetical protein [Leptospiraceae bacterium]